MKSEMTPEYGDAGILPRAEDVEVADRDRLEAVERGEELQVLLPHQLLQRIRRERVRAHVLALGQGRGVAIGRGRRGVDEALHLGVARRYQHVQRGVDVGAVRAYRVLHGLRDRRDGRLVQHVVGAVDALPGEVEVGQVALDELGARLDVARVAGDQAVDDADALAAGEQRLGQVGSDETGTAGDDVQGHGVRRSARSGEGEEPTAERGLQGTGKPNSVPLLTPADPACAGPANAHRGGDHSSGTAITRGLEQPTRTLRTGRPRTRPYLALLRAGFCLPRPLPAARCALTAPFHPYRRLGLAASPQAVYFLCHWSVGLPRPGITRRTALRSSDFPRSLAAPRSPVPLQPAVILAGAVAAP